jgi:hypothetical protein
LRFVKLIDFSAWFVIMAMQFLLKR